MNNSYTFRELRQEIRRDFQCSGARSFWGVLATCFWGTSFQLLFAYRLSRWFVALRMKGLCAPLKWFQFAVAGSEISPLAILGSQIHFPHPNGIIIGAGVVVEDSVWIFQQVTLGSHGRKAEGKNYPTICHGARLYSGCKIMGGVRIGTNATVGANSVVLCDVPDGTTAVGIPARVLAK